LFSPQTVVPKKQGVPTNGTARVTRTEQYWAVRSLWQFVTGSKSTLSTTQEHVIMEAALSYLSSMTPSSSSTTTTTTIDPFHDPKVLKAISNVVFTHKQILIPTKILLDTVVPQEHWTLKAAVKKGCACCIIEAEVEDEMEGGSTRRPFGSLATTTDAENDTMLFLPNNNNNNTTTVPQDGGIRQRPVIASKKRQTNYVDGKAGFAFDPTRFG